MEKIKILIAEDMKDTQELYDVGLISDVFDKHFAENGRIALDIYRSVKIDVIVLDIMMPELSGFAVLNVLRGEYGDSNTPVIMSTSISEKEDVVACVQKGIQGYILKPFHYKEIGFKILEYYKKVDPEKASQAETLLKDYFARKIAPHSD